MKKITCKKPCNIGGERFAIGDDVPEKLFAPGREATLVKYGLISVENVPDTPSTADSGNTPDGNADGLQQPTEGQQEGGEGNQPETDSSDDQKEPEEPATDTPDGNAQKPAKRGKK